VRFHIRTISRAWFLLKNCALHPVELNPQAAQLVVAFGYPRNHLKASVIRRELNFALTEHPRIKIMREVGYCGIPTAAQFRQFSRNPIIERPQPLAEEAKLGSSQIQCGDILIPFPSPGSLPAKPIRHKCSQKNPD
jgi:hypothetical protein